MPSIGVVNSSAGPYAARIGWRPSPGTLTTEEPVDPYEAMLEQMRLDNEARKAAFNKYLARMARDREGAAQRQKARDDLRTLVMGNIDAPGTDRLKAYEEYAKSIETGMTQDLDKRYAETSGATEGNLTARGLAGTAAYRDAMAALGADRAAIEGGIPIAVKGARDRITDRDRAEWNRIAQRVDMGMDSEGVMRLVGEAKAKGPLEGLPSSATDYYDAAALSTLKRWKDNAGQQMDLQRRSPSRGLGYVYGKDASSGGGASTRLATPTYSGYGASRGQIY